MNSFPKTLNKEFKSTFPSVWKENRLRLLRKDLTNHILSKDENDYFDIDRWARLYLDNNIKELQEAITDAIVPELKEIGRNCRTSYGNTALFIYSSETPPSSCYEDGF